jgi:hypothetical protein
MDHSRRANLDPLAPLKCWVFLGRNADERKQQGLRLGACPPLFNRTWPLKLPGGTREKVDFTCAPRIANNSCFIQSELLV